MMKHDAFEDEPWRLQHRRRCSSQVPTKENSLWLRWWSAAISAVLVFSWIHLSFTCLVKSMVEHLFYNLVLTNQSHENQI
jgi:hypothetical protein